jgi:hypothetical protein
MFSPRWLFFYPGLALMLAGFVLGGWLLTGPKQVGPAVLDIHTLLFCGAAFILGFQSVAFGALTRVFAVTTGLVPATPRDKRYFHPNHLEIGLLFGALILVAGLGIGFVALRSWLLRSFGPLDYMVTLRLVIPSVVFLTVGFLTILSSFFMSVLQLKTHGVKRA